MLILTRRIGERVVIAGGIVVTVVALDRGRVKLGFEAPPGLAIHREEIQQRIEAGQSRTQALRDGKGA